MKKMSTCLWFDKNAEEAVKFYASIFKGTKILKVARYGKNMPGPEGQVMTVTFRMLGQDFMALNGGPIFKFNESVSLMVNCETQKEVDTYWKKLTASGGQESQCGWLKDKYGLSWQVVPSIVGKYVADKNPKKSQAVMEAIMKMRKLDIKQLQAAYKNAGKRS